MDAGVRRVMGLISEINVRFVVPVYQRPYSWGDEQCLQLWDDILQCGRSREETHFTGSIVTMQDGSTSPAGVAALALIDGQQRITTITLLLVALARYASAHPDERLPYSRDEVMLGGYLTNPFRSGEDHYKLTLSKGDRATFRSIVDNLEDPSRPVDPSSKRIMHNLALFEQHLEALSDVGSVWVGLRRLEVVSVELTQGRDRAQLIFESMNSTGKDLGAADLIRNFVLMKYPLDRQTEAYRTYWKPLEDALLPLGEDDALDDFVRCFMQMTYAPEPLGPADLYQTFKRYVAEGGFDRNDRMGFLCLRLKDFAQYYVATVTGELAQSPVESAPDDPALRTIDGHLAGIAELGVPQARPLELELLRSCHRRECTLAQLATMLGVLESYLLRRAVCDCEGSAQTQFLLRLVAKLQAVRNAGEKYYDAYLALFLVEEGTPRRLPTDDEFARALRSRDCFGFSRSFYLLSRLNGHRVATAPASAAPGEKGAVPTREGWSVEHVMPVGALEDDAWRNALGPNPELAFERLENTLGNLVLTPYAYDLQDCSFSQKLDRLRKDADGAPERIALSSDVLDQPTWGPSQIEARGARLAREALAIWPMPTVDAETLESFRPTTRAASIKQTSWQDLFDAGVVQMDDALVSASPMYPGRATVTSTGKIMLANGQMFTDPTAAYERFLQTIGAHATGLNGWTHWRLGEGGPLLDDLR
ncbi:MAG: DUF262 domain-containing protein [Parafannyhessea sp.]|uniref:GmrSD restriction endonuclease domain-containing protein n=1 Tax=Parafannyhessea sp. TaxID=2847324 RepID=UPI003F01C765